MRSYIRLSLLAASLITMASPLLASSDHDGLTAHQIEELHNQMWVNQVDVGHDLSSGSGSECSFLPSDLPEASIEFIGGIGLGSHDHIGASGVAYDADSLRFDAGILLTKDRRRLRAVVHHTQIEGKGTNSSGVDTDNTGFLLMPGTRIYTQEETGVNVDVDGILDLSYTTHDGTFSGPSAWYVRPGVRAAVNRATNVGLFQVLYVWQSRRNIDGDNLYNQKSYVNSQAVAFDYACVVTEMLAGSVGISYIDLLDNSGVSGMETKFTDLHLRLGTTGDSRCQAGVALFTAIDGRSATGVNLRGAIPVQ